MTELQDLGIDNGMGFSATPESSGGFSVGDLWGKKAEYDFTKLGETIPSLKKVKGVIPIPSQAKIDRFEKTAVLLEMELGKVNREWIKPYEKLQDEADEAEYELRQAKIERDKKKIAKWQKEMERLEGQATITEEQLDEATKRRDEIYDHYRDAVAAFCSGHPTRKELADVPNQFLMPFINYLRGELLNPNA